MSRAELDFDRVPHATLPTRFGEFDIYGFENRQDGEIAVALVKGPLDSGPLPLVRVHSQCFTGDTLHSLRCDCGQQLEQALLLIQESGCGVLVYHTQEGRGIGLMNKLQAYELQEQGVDTVEANVRLGFEADQRSYSYCAEILKYLGATRIRFLSNNPGKIEGLQAEEIEVVERVPLIVESSPLSRGYLKTKKEKLGHLLD